MMFPRSPKLNLRPTLFHQSQVHPCWRQVSQVPATINGQVLHGLDLELLKLLLIVAFNPARGPHGNRLVLAFHLVFTFQPAGDHVELQHTDGAENDVVAALGEEHLGGAFFGQFLQTLAQLLGSGVRGGTVPGQSAEYR